MTDRKPSTAAGRVSKASKTPAATKSDTAANDASHPDDHEAAAYKRGSSAGKTKDAHEQNPYQDGSDAAKSFEHGQLDAQKVRSSDKPPGR